LELLPDVELLLLLGDGPTGGALTGYYTVGNASSAKAQAFRHTWLLRYPHLAKVFALGAGFVVPDYHFGMTCSEQSSIASSVLDIVRVQANPAAAIHVGPLSCENDEFAAADKLDRSEAAITSDLAYFRGSLTGDSFARFNATRLLDRWRGAGEGTNPETSALWMRMVLHKLGQLYPASLNVGVNPALLDKALSDPSLSPTDRDDLRQLRQWLAPFHDDAKGSAHGLLRHRFLLDVTGNGWSSSFTARAHANRTLLKRSDGLVEWFYPRLLSAPTVCWVAPDLSDLVPSLHYLRAHKDLAAELAHRSLSIAEEHFSVAQAARYMSDWLHVYSELLRFDVTSPTPADRMTKVVCQQRPETKKRPWSIRG
jgi:hypothetical protein